MEPADGRAGERIRRAAARGHHGVQRRDRRGHEAPGLVRAPERDPRIAGGSCRGPDGARADVRDQAARTGPGQCPGAADPCGPRGPRALPERALHAPHAAAARRGARHQRERHGGHRRDQVRRQRHPWRAGCEPRGSRCAGHPDGPEGPLHGGPAARSSCAVRARGGGRRSFPGGDGGRRGHQHRTRGHDHQDHRGQACGRLGGLPR